MAGVTDKRAKWDKVVHAASKIPRSSAVYVGVTGDMAEKPHDAENLDLTNAQLAAIHEFGLGDATERPFIRPATDKNTKKYLKLGQVLSEKVIDGDMTIEQLEGTIGAVAKADIQNYIARNQVKPPSSKATNKRKKSSVTLVDHGILKASIDWRTGTDTPPAPPLKEGVPNVFDLQSMYGSGGDE